MVPGPFHNHADNGDHVALRFFDTCAAFMDSLASDEAVRKIVREEIAALQHKPLAQFEGIFEVMTGKRRVEDIAPGPAVATEIIRGGDAI